MGNRLTPTAAPEPGAGAVSPWRRKAAWFLGLWPELLGRLRRAEETGRSPEPGRWNPQESEHFEISFNLVRHLFDLCAVAFLCLASPFFRACVDVLGLRGLAALWLHGLALFLFTSYGMTLVLWLLHTYLAQLTLAFGALHLLVLGVSLRRAQRTDQGETLPPSAEEATPGPSTPQTSREEPAGDGTRTFNETVTS